MIRQGLLSFPDYAALGAAISQQKMLQAYRRVALQDGVASPMERRP